MSVWRWSLAITAGAIAGGIVGYKMASSSQGKRKPYKWKMPWIRLRRYPHLKSISMRHDEGCMATFEWDTHRQQLVRAFYESDLDPIKDSGCVGMIGPIKQPRVLDYDWQQINHLIEHNIDTKHACGWSLTVRYRDRMIMLFDLLSQYTCPDVAFIIMMWNHETSYIDPLDCFGDS
jgi:hypothetical protein